MAIFIIIELCKQPTLVPLEASREKPINRQLEDRENCNGREKNVFGFSKINYVTFGSKENYFQKESDA